MADSTEDNTKSYHQSLLSLSVIAVVAGLVIQSFVVIVNVSDWWKGRSVTPVDHIITSLGISRLCLPCALTLFLFLFGLLLENLYSYVTLVVINEIYSFFVYLDIWLSSLLSIVFYLKITNLHTRLFLYLRRLIVHRTVYFIVASVLLSIFSCSFSLLTAITEATKGGTYNTTMNNVLVDCTYTTFLYTFAIVAFFPVLFYFISSILLFASLYHHISRMKTSGNSTINLETYYSAMKFIIFTFTYNTIYLFGRLFCMIYYYVYCIDLVQLYFVLEFLPVLHSSFLIYRTAKLRSQMYKVLHRVTDFLFQRKDTETRGDIEVAAQ